MIYPAVVNQIQLWPDINPAIAQWIVAIFYGWMDDGKSGGLVVAVGYAYGETGCSSLGHAYQVQVFIYGEEAGEVPTARVAKLCVFLADLVKWATLMG